MGIKKANIKSETSEKSETSKKIKEKAKQLGYSACGIIPAEPYTEYLKALDERVSAFPSSKEVYKPMYVNGPPEGGKSIITCILGHNRYIIPKNLAPYIGKHYLFDERLPFTEENRAKIEFETFLKNMGLRLLEGQIPLRWAAAKAGIGKFGFNNCTYSGEHGSYCTVHAWTVDLPLEYEPAPEGSLIAEECSENCLACVSACPTGALCGSLMLDRAQCVTQLANIDHNLPDDDTYEKIGRWIYGCDACQDVCPINKDKHRGTEVFPLLDQYEELLKPENILEMDAETYTNIINPRFWYLGEDALWKWKCNALRVIIVEGDAKFYPLVKRHLNDDDPRIRQVAKWGCDKLRI